MLHRGNKHLQAAQQYGNRSTARRKLLISLYFLLPNLSSICQKAQPARVGGTSQPTSSQSYPHILWVIGQLVNASSGHRHPHEKDLRDNRWAFICAEIQFVFNHTSRRLADLATGCVLHPGLGARH
jgi:hypothetical protein